MTIKLQQDIQYRAYRKFRENLTMQLLEVTENRPQLVADTVQPGPRDIPKWRTLQRKSYCKWCLDYKNEATKKRKILGELPNGARQAFIPQTGAACDCYGIPLYRKSDYWTLYHNSIAHNGSTEP
jgi:hypothetical protein